MATNKTSSKTSAKKEADPKPAPAPAKAEKPAPAKPAPEKKQKQPAVPKPTGSEVTDKFDKPIRRLAPKDWVEKMKAAPRLTPVVGVVVFSKSEYEDPDIPLDARSFRCSSDSPLFMGTGTSLDGDSLDGVDVGMTLEAMLDGPDKWEVDYCYIPKVGGFPLHPRHFLATPTMKDRLGKFYGGDPMRAHADEVIAGIRENYRKDRVPFPSMFEPELRRDILNGKYDKAERLYWKAWRFTEARLAMKNKWPEELLRDNTDRYGNLWPEAKLIVAAFVKQRECPSAALGEPMTAINLYGLREGGDVRGIWLADTIDAFYEALNTGTLDKANSNSDAIHEHLYSGHDKRTEKVWGVKPNGEPVRKGKAPAKAPAKPAKAAPAPAKAGTAPDKAPAKPAPAPGKAKPAPARSRAR